MTILGYRQNENTESSPAEFFAIICKIYEDFIKAVDMILWQPHHEMRTVHEVLPSHKIKATDVRGVRWLEKHPQHIARAGGRFAVDQALAVRRQVTYDTKENRLTKYVLQSTA